MLPGDQRAGVGICPGPAGVGIAQDGVVVSVGPSRPRPGPGPGPAAWWSAWVRREAGVGVGRVAGRRVTASAPARPGVAASTYDGGVFGVVLLLFLILPILEILIIIQVGQAVGGYEAVGLMILISLVGAWMVRREGLGLIRGIRSRLEEGALPTRELVDGLLVAIAGALLLTPGFLTDGIGLLLLFLPTRALVRTVLIRRFRLRMQTGLGVPMDESSSGPMGPAGPGPMGRRGPGPMGGGPVIDVGEARYRPSDDDPGPGAGPGPDPGSDPGPDPEISPGR